MPLKTDALKNYVQRWEEKEEKGIIVNQTKIAQSFTPISLAGKEKHTHEHEAVDMHMKQKEGELNELRFINHGPAAKKILQNEEG